MNTRSRTTSTCRPRLGAILLAALAFGIYAPRVDAQAEGAADEAPLQLKAGEIRLEGKVASLAEDGSGLSMAAASFTLPSGKTGRIEVAGDKAKAKIIRVGADTLLYTRGAPESRLALSRLQPGWLVAVVGEDKGSGQPLTARALAVWTDVRDGKYLLNTPKNDAAPNKALQEAPQVLAERSNAIQAVASLPRVARAAASLAASLAARQARSVLKNGDFEVQDGLQPTGWMVPQSPAVSIIEDEEENHYVLLRAVGEFDKRKIARLLTLDARWKTLKFSARVRARGLQPPPQPFQNAHVGVIFQNAAGKELGLNGPIALEQDTDWELVSGVAEIPPGAVRAVVDAGNFGSAGEFGLDDLSIEPDAAPDSIELRDGFPEGRFEEINANGRAQGWPLLGGAQVRIEEEGDNHFLRLSLPKNGVASVDALVTIPPAAKTLRVQARMRVQNIKLGQEVWENARLGLTFLGAGGSKVGEWPPALEVKQDTDWALLGQTFSVPEGAIFLRLTPQLLNTSGTLDIDDIQIQTVP